MKKIILTILLLFLALPCFAGNLLQQEYETAKMAEMAQSPAFYNISKEHLLENDYQGYLNGGRSLYGYLLKAKEEAKDAKNNVELKYINLMLNQYNIQVKTINSKIFYLQKIKVNDKDYKKLSDLTKLCLYFYNIIAN